MASTDYDFHSTRNQLIERALKIVGALSQGQPMSAEALASANQALNDMVKAWTNKRVFLWTQKIVTFNTVAGTKSYTATSDPAVIGIDRAYIRESNDDDFLTPISFREYQGIDTKSEGGRPTHIALDTTSIPTIYLWPQPDSVLAIYYIGITKLQDFDTAGGNASFPVRMIQALTYGLAVELAPEYGLPLGERQLLQGQASQHFLDALVGDRDYSQGNFIKST